MNTVKDQTAAGFFDQPLIQSRLFWLLVVCLMLVHGVFMTPLLVSSLEMTLGRHPLFFIRIGLALVTIGLIFQQPGAFRQVVFRDRLLLILHGFVLLSAVWSLRFSESLSAALALMTTSLLGIVIASRCTLKEQILLVMTALIILVVLSLITVALFPQYGIMSQPLHAGRWNGVLFHKNPLGFAVSMLAIILIYMPRSVIHLNHKLRVGLLLLVGLILLATDAAAAQMFTLLFVLFAPVYKLWQDYPRARRILLIVLVVGIVLVVIWLSTNYNYDRVLAVFGRYPTLTGRTQLWDSALKTIADRPLLGYGYQAAFEPASPIHLYKDWKEAQFAHNILLDIMLELGLAGTLLFLVGYLRTLLRAFVLWQTTGKPEMGFVLLFALFVFASGLTDTNALSNRDMWWVIYVATTVSLADRWKNR